MSKIEDGGTAFPRMEFRQLGAGGAGHMVPVNGMSLRDWFAGQALIGLVTLGAGNSPANAYRVADAMLKIRKLEPES
jgi:hypothetical protein